VSHGTSDRIRTLSAIAGRHTKLTPAQIRHLHQLLGEWQTLADLAFADCLLFAWTVDDKLIVLAQVRPYPAQTLYPDDEIGRLLSPIERPKVVGAITEGRIVREGDPEWRDGTPIRQETVPVRCDGEVIAVICVEQNLAAARTPSHLELAYLRAAGNLEQMICEGVFPFESEEEIERELSPRVGDGFLEMDATGVITYASPNATSAYRRLGVNELIARSLWDIGVGHKRVLNAMRAHRTTEDEVQAEGAWVLRRFIPVVLEGEVRGCLGLVRDVTESRKRDRVIRAKDARLREIHHRVKNNLQTVASLLRIQARRLDSPEARLELEESVRRIQAIALVHETLAQDPNHEVSFDEVATRITAMVTQGLVRPDAPVRCVIEGRAGDLVSEVATPMSLILTELLQNAIEHAFADRGGTVRISFTRAAGTLRLEVADDGAGLPEGFLLDGARSIGMQIVQTMVGELGGTVSAARAEPGARFTVEVPVTDA
jgi:two-component sensor histidine kinase